MRDRPAKRADQTRDGQPRDSKRDGRSKGRAATKARKAQRARKLAVRGAIQS